MIWYFYICFLWIKIQCLHTSYNYIWKGENVRVYTKDGAYCKFLVYLVILISIKILFCNYFVSYIEAWLHYRNNYMHNFLENVFKRSALIFNSNIRCSCPLLSGLISGQLRAWKRTLMRVYSTGKSLLYPWKKFVFR